MKLKLSLFLVALTLCLANTVAKTDPLKKLTKMKGVTCYAFDSIPSQGIHIGENINLGSEANEMVKPFDPRNITLILAEQEKPAKSLFDGAIALCKKGGYETLVNVNNEDQFTISAKFGDTRSDIILALFEGDDKDGVVLSVNVKGNRETIMELLKGKVTFTH